MVRWIVWGAPVVGLLLLVVAGWLLSKRARPLRRALRRLEIRAEEAARLQTKVDRARRALATLAAALPSSSPSDDHGRGDEADDGPPSVVAPASRVGAGAAGRAR